jgi:hypothetical protein
MDMSHPEIDKRIFKEAEEAGMRLEEPDGNH